MTARNALLRPLLLAVGMMALVVVLGLSGLTAVAHVTIDPNPPPNAPDWSVPLLVSPAIQNAFLPRVALSPVDDRVLVVYTLQLSDQLSSTDPYYNLSTDGGATWLPFPQPIFASSGVPSIQVNAAFDANGRAHAAWVEALNLVYARRDQNTWGAPLTISAINEGAGATDPVVVASGANVIDILWSEASGLAASFDVKHARSVDGGATWTLRSDVAVTGAREQHGKLVVDPANVNRLHVVYESGPAAQRTVYYTQGTVQGGSVTWSAPAQISQMNSNDREPDLLVRGAQVSVTYSHLETFNDKDYQLVYYVSCNQNCTQAGSWSGPTNVSGAYLTVNETLPFYIRPVLLDAYGCKFTYYHGVNIDFSPNERIYGVNSCAGWNGGGIETLTMTGERAINPAGAYSDDGWFYLVYELFTDPPGLTQIHFTRGLVPTTLLPQTNVFLPVVLRK